MRHYEIVALVHPDQSAQIDEIVARYRKIVEDSGGIIHRQENWGRRKLAYPIKKIYKADYFLLNIECEPSVKDKIENDFKYYDSIIRSLFIRKDHAVTEQSPILKKLIKQEEEERVAKEREVAELARLRAEEAARAAAAAEKERAAEAEQSAEDGAVGVSDETDDETIDTASEAETEHAEGDESTDNGQSEPDNEDKTSEESELKAEPEETTA